MIEGLSAHVAHEMGEQKVWKGENRVWEGGSKGVGGRRQGSLSWGLRRTGEK